MNQKNKKKVKAIGVVSGGLDSTLAATLIKDQGVEICLLNFMPASEASEIYPFGRLIKNAVYHYC